MLLILIIKYPLILLAKKMSLFKMAEELQFQIWKLWQMISKYRQQKRGTLFYKEKKESEKGFISNMFIRGNWQFEL